MEQVPDMISTKDLSYLEDMFNWHFSMVKKCNHYSNLSKIEEISDFIKKIGKEHEKICNKIIKKLDSEV